MFCLSSAVLFCFVLWHDCKRFVCCRYSAYVTRKRGIANALQPEAARATPALSRFINALPSLTSLNLSVDVLYKAFAADTLLHAVTLTFDLWLWTITAYRLWRDETLYQIWTQSSNPRRSYGDFSVWPYNLEHCISCRARLWGNFHQVSHSAKYPCLNYGVFYADTLCHAVTLIFEPLTLKLGGTSSVTWSKSVRNLSEIEKYSA